MKNSYFALSIRDTKQFLYLFSLSVFACLLSGLICAASNSVQAQTSTERQFPKRDAQRKNQRQIMLEQMALENTNKKANSARSGALLQSGLDMSFNPSVISTNAFVETIVTLSDGKILVGGSFTSYNGAARSNIARLNGDGSLDQTFNAATNGFVRSISVQSDGKILLGGSFSEVNGTSRENAARLNADGTLDTTFNFGGADSVVHDIKQQTDGKVIIGGDFTQVANTLRNRIARLNADGSLDSTFNPGAGPNNSVYGLDLQADGKIMITGLFDYVSGAFRRQAARLNADGSFDPTFDFSGINFFGGVGFDVLVQPDGKILLAGFFQTAFQDIVLLARVNPSGTQDQAFNLVLDDFLDDHIEDVELLPDGKIAVGGYFSLGSTNVIRRVARLNANGTVDAAFNPGTSTNSAVGAVAAQADGKILTGGFFTSYQAAPQNRLARLNTDGGLDTTFNIGGGITKSEPGTIYASAVQTDGKILIGGNFQQVNGIGRNNIARLNADGSLDTTFNPGNGTEFPLGFYSPVYSISIAPNNMILIGGSFSRYNNQFSDNIARLNPSGSLDTNFLGFTYDPVWKVLVQPNGKILVGGQFTYFNDFPRNFITRLDDSGELDYDFNANGPSDPEPSADSVVFDIALQADGKIIIGGEFQKYNNVSRNRIARLNQDGSLDAAFAPNGGADAAIRSAALQTDSKILIGGSFTSFNSVSRNRIARINSDGSLDTTFNPGTGANRTIFDIQTLSDGKFLIGGAFTQFNGASRNFLARLNANGSLDSGFTSQTDGEVRNISVHPENKVLISGRFGNVNGVLRTGIARLDPLKVTSQIRTPFDFDGDGKADVSIFRPNGAEWWINKSSGGLIALQFGNSADKIVPGDYTGDGKADVAIFRPSTGQWFILRSEDLSFYAFPFGANGDVPVPADYDGDGKTDAAVFRPSNSSWYILKSSGGTIIQTFGQSNDRPANVDYDGDGKTDIAIYRPDSGQWWVQRSSNATVYALQFGEAADQIVPADYTGDGKADIALFRPSNGFWYILRSEDNSFYGFPFGVSGDVPVSADYDGDGKTDPAVFRNGVWYLQQSSNGISIQQFGLVEDSPIPLAIYR